jgi:hypothetical protein
MMGCAVSGPTRRLMDLIEKRNAQLAQLATALR